MKRFGAILLALCMLPMSIAAAQEDESTSTIDQTAFGVTVVRTHEVRTTDRQRQAIDYPVFESENEALAKFLTDSITTPILALRNLGQMAEDDAYTDGALDTIRSGYFASTDFLNLLSIEATVSNRAAGATAAQTSFIYRIVDVSGPRVLTVEELFLEPADVVTATIRAAVYQKASDQNILLEGLSDATAVPLPNSYYLTSDYFRTIYAAGTVSADAVVIDIPWQELGLTASALLTPATEADKATAVVTDTADATQGEAAPEVAPVEGATDVVDASEEADVTEDEPAEMMVEAEPDSIDLAQVDATQPEAADTADVELATEEPTAEAAQAPQAEAVPLLDPAFSLPPVITPTPMPLAGNDAVMVDVLTHGLWKQLGTDGETYYQFTADGKLLTVTVSDYTVADGNLQSDVLNGTLDIGSDSAFSLRLEDGTPVGYVLNRQGDAVAPEELVTPTPSPVPTPTPSATPVPTPTPTPIPTPTLSPYEQALTQSPSLAALSDASFEKQRTLRVYSAPSEDAYRDSRAQVTTDDTVTIYGVENNWVLVSYSIGNGSRGRVGYIENTTLSDPENVAQLQFSSIEMELRKDADATDDPLNGKNMFLELKAGDSVTLLAFMGSEWAYVETTYEDKPCRVFIAQSALMEE